MLATDGVAAFKDFSIRLPASADLGSQLLLDARQGLAFHAAELRGLVLYAEQEGVLVFDVASPTIRRTVRCRRGVPF